MVYLEREAKEKKVSSLFYYSKFLFMPVILLTSVLHRNSQRFPNSHRTRPKMEKLHRHPPLRKFIPTNNPSPTTLPVCKAVNTELHRLLVPISKGPRFSWTKDLKK